MRLIHNNPFDFVKLWAKCAETYLKGEVKGCKLAAYCMEKQKPLIVIMLFLFQIFQYNLKDTIFFHSKF